MQAHYVGGARDRQRAKGLGGGAKERDGVWKEAIMQNTSTTINLCPSRSAAAITLQSSSAPPGAVATFPRFFSRLQLPHTQSPVCCRRVRVWAHQSQTLHWRARATAPPVSGHMTSPGISVEDHREVQWLHSCTACAHAICLLPTNRDKLKGSGFTAVFRSAVH